MKFSIKDIFSKYDQIRSFLLISTHHGPLNVLSRPLSHLLKKSLMEIFMCSVEYEGDSSAQLLKRLQWLCLAHKFSSVVLQDDFMLKLNFKLESLARMLLIGLYYHKIWE